MTFDPTDDRVKRMEERMRRAAREHGLGATGRHVEQPLGDHDEGELKVGITTEGNQVVINFGKKVAWVSMTPEQIREFAAVLVSRADQIEGKG